MSKTGQVLAICPENVKIWTYHLEIEKNEYIFAQCSEKPKN